MADAIVVAIGTASGKPAPHSVTRSPPWGLDLGAAVVAAPNAGAAGAAAPNMGAAVAAAPNAGAALCATAFASPKAFSRPVEIEKVKRCFGYEM